MKKQNNKLLGKRIVIVGASSGIGYALTEALTAQGAKLGVAARRTDRLDALADKYPSQITTAQIDVTDNDAPAHLEQLVRNLGGLDIYLHVAGIGYDNPSLDPTREADFVNTNATGFARMISAAYNLMRKAGGGHIAAITSVAGTKGIGVMSAYSAGKQFDYAYLTALSQLSHNEHAGIRFTDIRPGWTTTPLLDSDRKYMMEMTQQHAVKCIVRAIIKKKRIAYIDWRWGIVCRLWRMVPSWLWERMNPRLWH